MLANLELDQLIAHKHGKDVSEAMALLNKLVRGEGEEQQEALKRVCAMAAEGRLVRHTPAQDGRTN